MIATKEGLNEFIGKHLFERSQFYNQADLSIKTDGLAVSEVVQAIMDQINQSK
jgi:shikimate kinase